MSHPVYQVPAGDVLPIFFSTYAGATGASITMTGLAVTDIEIYKDASMTQRASDAGYALIDTDGIDIDSLTGIHGFTIDTGDNTDASFYTVGAWFTVVVSAVTVDAQTVNFIAAQFRIVPAEASAGVPSVNATLVGGQTASAAGAVTFPGTIASTTNITAGTITTVTNLTNAPTAGDLTATMKTSVTTAATAATPALSAGGVDAIHDDVFEGSLTFRQIVRLMAAVLLGKASGLATSTAVYRDLGDTKDRITATVDADGNRSAVTRDGT